MTSLERLINLVPPPSAPDPFMGDTLMPGFGPECVLPGDYLEFMKVYGPGWFTEIDNVPDLQIFDLCSGNDAPRFELLLSCLNEGHEELPSMVPAAYPTSDGLLPWGSDNHGYTFYWRASQLLSVDWPIVIDIRSAFVEYSFAFVDALKDVLSRESSIGIYVNTFTDSRRIGYCPSSRYHEYLEHPFELR